MNAGMVVNQGKDRRAELRRLLGLKKSDKLVYLYVGRYGQSDLDWPRLGRHESGRRAFRDVSSPARRVRLRIFTRCPQPTGRAAT